ncbi:MAG TPA: hypothetical protein VFV38_15205 [Ktedonobacteraceae bacterium]|nr:hypothetical protein [Ktedonobacteraceae bacterium]
MGDVIAIVSSQEIIPTERLLEVIQKAGGYRDPDEVTGHLAYSEQGSHIWIHLDDTILPCIAAENPEEFAQITKKLGGEPRTSIAVEIDSAPGSQTLAIDFACICATTWPCVVDTLEEDFQVFSLAEIMQMRMQGKTFADYAR